MSETTLFLVDTSRPTVAYGRQISPSRALTTLVWSPAIGGRWPDRTVILDMPAEASIARVTRAKDRIEQRPLDYHRRVRDNYLAQAAAMPDRYRVVRADRAVEVVHDEVMRVIQI